MDEWENFKKELLQNKEVAREYERLKPHYQLIAQLIEARIKKGLTQQQLAQKIGTKQSVIARVESGNSNPTFAFIEKITTALGSQLIIEIK